MTNAELLSFIITNFEGGFVDDPDDHGGATNYGVTAADYGEFLGLGHPASANQVRNMTMSDAITIFQRRYIDAPGFGVVPLGTLRLVVVDSGILFGQGTAAMWLQTALGLQADGILGPISTAALAKLTDYRGTAQKVLVQRFRRIGRIVGHDPTQVRFVEGWLNRTAMLLEMI